MEAWVARSVVVIPTVPFPDTKDDNYSLPFNNCVDFAIGYWELATGERIGDGTRGIDTPGRLMDWLRRRGVGVTNPRLRMRPQPREEDSGAGDEGKKGGRN
jgi:hypothetical protein